MDVVAGEYHVRVENPPEGSLYEPVVIEARQDRVIELRGTPTSMITIRVRNDFESPYFRIETKYGGPDSKEVFSGRERELRFPLSAGRYQLRITNSRGFQVGYLALDTENASDSVFPIP